MTKHYKALYVVLGGVIVVGGAWLAVNTIADNTPKILTVCGYCIAYVIRGHVNYIMARKASNLATAIIIYSVTAILLLSVNTALNLTAYKIFMLWTAIVWVADYQKQIK